MTWCYVCRLKGEAPAAHKCNLFYKGYDVKTNEVIFTYKHILLQNNMIRYKGKPNMLYLNIIYNDYNKYIQRIKSRLTLQQWCRIQLRRQTNAYHYKNFIVGQPIPKKLKDYLLEPNINDTLLYYNIKFDFYPCKRCFLCGCYKKKIPL